MMSHVVLMKPRADLDASERRAFVESFERALQEIPSVRAVRIGRRVTFGASYEAMAHEAGEYLAVIDFDDLAGLQAYLAHPAHQDLGSRFYRTLSAAMVFDYEVWGSEGLTQLI